MKNNVEFQTIATSHYSGLQGKEHNYVIRQESDWKKFWDSYTSTSFPKEDLPAVDFSNQMVLVAFSGVKNSGGYGITIESITKKDDCLEILVKKNTFGGMATMALTQPSHIVLTEKYDGKINFVDKK